MNSIDESFFNVSEKDGHGFLSDDRTALKCQRVIRGEARSFKLLSVDDLNSCGELVENLGYLGGCEKNDCISLSFQRLCKQS